MTLTEHAQPESSASHASGALRRHAALVAALVVVAALATAVFTVVSGALIDDAYITLGYARNLALHGHWGLIETEQANSATSPLNVLVLAACTLVVRDPIVALGVVFVLATVVTAGALWTAARDGGLPRPTGVLAALLVLGNPLLLSAVGLEMNLAAALLAVLLMATVRPRPVVFGGAAGLLALTRLDLGVFVLVVLIGRPSLWRAWWKWLLTACAVALPWFTLSWWLLGSAVPDTLVIKQLQATWGKWGFGNGLQLYAGTYPSATGVAVAAAALGLAALPVWLLARVLRSDGARRLHPWALLGIGGVAHFFAYTRLDVPPYHWYYAPALIGLSITFAGAIGAVARNAAPRRPLPLLAAAALVAAACGVLVAQGRVLVEQGTPWRIAPITTNWATPSEYARIGRLVGARIGDATVRSPGEIGTLAYYCRCSIVDGFSDRGYLADQLDQRLSQLGPTGRWLLRANYTHFTPSRPREIDYVLHRVDGYGPDPRWNIHSPWMGPGHLVLERADSR